MKIPAAAAIACVLTFSGAGGLRLAADSFDATPADGGEAGGRAGHQADPSSPKTGKSGAAAENSAAAMVFAGVLTEGRLPTGRLMQLKSGIIICLIPLIQFTVV